MTNDHNDWNSWSLCFMLAASMFHVCGLYVSCLRPLCFTFAASMFHVCGLYVSCLRPLCFMLAASMFHACGLYVSCLRPLSTTHGYDKGRIAFWGARKRLGALAVLCGFERRACKHRGCEAGLKHWGWVCAFWLVLFGRAFSGSFFWSFFSWFVLWVRAFGRSFRGSFFCSFFCSFFLWFVLLGARMCFFSML